MKRPASAREQAVFIVQAEMTLPVMSEARGRCVR